MGYFAVVLYIFIRKKTLIIVLGNSFIFYDFMRIVLIIHFTLVQYSKEKGDECMERSGGITREGCEYSGGCQARNNIG